jgi:cbb3-type cytochrome oxidase subunit 3
MTTILILIAVLIIAKVANAYQKRWQARRDEELLISNAANFTSAWGRSEAQVDERYRDTITEADILADRQRIIAAQEDEQADALPDAAYISAAVRQISHDAANGMRVPADNPPLAQLERDKRMFARIEQEKAARGILPLNEDGIFYEPVAPRRG